MPCLLPDEDAPKPGTAGNSQRVIDQTISSSIAHASKPSRVTTTTEPKRISSRRLT